MCLATFFTVTASLKEKEKDEEEEENSSNKKCSEKKSTQLAKNRQKIDDSFLSVGQNATSCKIFAQ